MNLKSNCKVIISIQEILLIFVSPNLGRNGSVTIQAAIFCKTPEVLTTHSPFTTANKVGHVEEI